ncbi:MAG: hypothetical protein AAGF97_17960 [Planctomycetota bacterium]
MYPTASVRRCFSCCFLFVLASYSPLLAHNRVLAPNGGETLIGGTPHDIVWGIDIPHALVDWDVWYSTTSAQGPWIEIAMDLPPGDPSKGSVHEFTWSVPAISAAEAWIRVRMDNDDSIDVDYEDVSDGSFRIELANLLCDFDASGGCDLEDLNLLLAAGPVSIGVPVSGPHAAFDLTGDGQLDNADVNAWLAIAASENGFSAPYLRGDANLDGVVNGADFLQWNAAKFTSTLRWDGGDFNGDGLNDGADFLVWNSSKFTSVAAPVPEPSGYTFWPFLAIVTALRTLGTVESASRC